jgi:hypothetical protein
VPPPSSEGGEKKKEHHSHLNLVRGRLRKDEKSEGGKKGNGTSAFQTSRQREAKKHYAITHSAFVIILSYY